MTLLAQALKKAVVVAAVGCFLFGGFVAVAMSNPGADTREQSGNVSVNRINKGDRLSGAVTLKRTPAVTSPAVSAAGRPPIGCDPAFSLAADPKRTHIFGRCIT